jgi:organic hydroperoxide reductase OsmC/OhrA
MVSKRHSYHVSVSWTGNRGQGTSGYRAYDRSHEVTAGPAERVQASPERGRPQPIAGSSDPAFRGDPDRWNPEQLLTASLAQCHMLWYLHLCAVAGVVVTGYADAEVIEACRGPGALRVETQGERRAAVGVRHRVTAAVEPLIAGFWQRGREQTRHVHAPFWTRMAGDGLLDPDTDLDWLIDTTTLLSGAETYLLITRMVGWDLDTYQDWLVTSMTGLAAAGGAPVPRSEG